MNRGGKIVTPIREAILDDGLTGVIFRCDDKDRVEKVRISACVANERNGFKLKTHRSGNDLMVYKPAIDLYDDNVDRVFIEIDLRNRKIADETDF